ncbi:MAG: 1-aminocyclopropane-1-carboxylate deaminase/D-cysteine desulfhydrase [Cyclobacteriaceae bacterium]
MSSADTDLFLSYREPPVLSIQHPAFENAGISVSVLREDLNHPFVSGNKWWKLRDNIKEAKRSGKPVLTFGGAFSNHIFATAAACNELKIPCTGIIRGEAGPVESSTIRFAKSCGMEIIRVTRGQYRKKEDSDFFDLLPFPSSGFYIIPEGGTNNTAVRSCMNWGQKIAEKFRDDFDCILLPAGTGGTAAGLIAGINGDLFVHVFSVLKSGDFLQNNIARMLEDLFSLIGGFNKNLSAHWKLHTNYHFGGYGKRNDRVLNFMKLLSTQSPLDAVYTAKMFLGIADLADLGAFNRGSRLLAIHTGGLQGNSGFLI